LKEEEMIKSFRDLRVWQLGMDLAVEAYRLSGSFPKHEAYGLGAQMQRAAVSVPSNIAEGHAREHRKEYLHHLSTAQASLAELETHVELSARLEYCSLENLSNFLRSTDSLGKQLRALRTALKSPRKPSGRNGTVDNP
jgi:four helix bundle protein